MALSMPSTLKDGYYYKHSSHRLLNHIISETGNTNSKITCSTLCAKEKQCVSFNYKHDQSSRICQLNKATRAILGEYVKDSNWDYYEFMGENNRDGSNSAPVGDDIMGVL